jgi:hypothetical protein
VRGCRARGCGGDRQRRRLRRCRSREFTRVRQEHYLKSAPRKDWEKIAYMVEDRLPLKGPVAKAPAAATVVAARVAPALP